MYLCKGFVGAFGPESYKEDVLYIIRFNFLCLMNNMTLK
jgi:hypothetical protein